MDKLVTRQSRLADPNHGTAIKSFRKSEDQKSKPLNVIIEKNSKSQSKDFSSLPSCVAINIS
jgi:hypothetical protein